MQWCDARREARAPVRGQQHRQCAVQCHLDHRPVQFTAQALPGDTYQRADHEHGEQRRADRRQRPWLAVEMEYHGRTGGAEEAAQQTAGHAEEKRAQPAGRLDMRMRSQHQQYAGYQDHGSEQLAQQPGHVAVQARQQSEPQADRRHQPQQGPGRAAPLDAARMPGQHPAAVGQRDHADHRGGEADRREIEQCHAAEHDQAQREAAECLDEAAQGGDGDEDGQFDR